MWPFTERTPYADQTILRPDPPAIVTNNYYGNGTALPKGFYDGMTWLKPLLHTSGGGSFRATMYQVAPTGPNGTAINLGHV